MKRKASNRKIVKKGTRYNNYIVLDSTSFSDGKKAIWLVKCDCGKEKKILANNVMRGLSKSCGCLKKMSKESSYNQIYREYKTGAKKRNIEFKLTKNDVKKFIKGKCYYCGDSPKKKLHHYSKLEISVHGIDRKDNNKGYNLKNCVTCCTICNRMKMEKELGLFLAQCEKIYKNTGHIIDKFGNIMHEVEYTISKMVEQHEMQKGEILALYDEYIDLHHPGCIEEYTDDNSNPIYFYGPIQTFVRKYKKQILEVLNGKNN